MSKNRKNKNKIKKFTATDRGKNLEEYLKNKAWSDDSKGETRVYLVKDEDDEIVLFFSLKCGLLYKKYIYDKLEKIEKDYVDMIVEAKMKNDVQAVQDYYEIEIFEDDRRTGLFQIANERFEIKRENIKLNDELNAHKVEECFSAIELQYFCKNNSYKPKKILDVPIGVGVFWEVIVPLVCDINETIGCRYLYLFAADNTNNKNEKDLVKYYKTSLKFDDIGDLIVVKPYYDIGCYSLYQEISELGTNREVIWQQFSDVLGMGKG